MLAMHPKLTVLRVRGWPLLLFGLVLAIGVSVPVISPAAMAQRSVPPPPTAPDPPPVPPLWMPVAGAVVRGSVVGPIEDPFGNTKLGLQFETVVDRTKFGLNWNAPLPKGGFALANEVKLLVNLELGQA